ncbi:MAG: FAD-binding protein [Treponema sp.]|nr:FAD-binding protein [Treponema sp.]
MRTLLRPAKLSLLLVVLLAGTLALTGCPGNGNGGGGGGLHRTPVQDGSWTITTMSYHRVNPAVVTTQFQNNRIVSVIVEEHSDTLPFMLSVENNYIPRVIRNQSVGLFPMDAVAAATMSTMGVRNAVMGAIDAAGGRSAEWAEAFPRRGIEAVSFDHVYDVIVIGLGGAGTNAFLAASDVPGTSVLGLEAAGIVGGTSNTVQGGFAVGSEWLVETYGAGAAGSFQGQLNNWSRDDHGLFGGMGATYGFSLNYFSDLPYALTGTARYPGGVYQGGGAKPDIVEWLITDSGPTVDWMARSHGFKFAGPGAVSQIATSRWVFHPAAVFPPAPAFWGWQNDWDGSVWNNGAVRGYKSQIFQNAISTAALRNNMSAYAHNIRATDLIAPASGAGSHPYYYTVVATHTVSGQQIRVLGRTVVLSTGGFLANHGKMIELFGASVEQRTVSTQQGDGIRMGRQAGGATYNLRTPPTGNIASVPNVIRTAVPLRTGQDAATWHGGLRWKNTVTSIAMSPDGMRVAVNRGFDGIDRAGDRFAQENNWGIQSWAAGGLAAVILCAGQIERIREYGFWSASVNPFFMTQHVSGGDWNPGTGAGNPRNRYAINVPVAAIDDIIDWAVEVGNAIRAPTLAGLAAQLNAMSNSPGSITEQRLQNAIIRYNSMIDAGADTDFNKPAMANRPRIARPVITGPVADSPAGTENWNQGFVAVFFAGVFYCTVGGLDVDIYMNVLNPQQQPIPGLFAAGQDSMGVIYHGNLGYGGGGQAFTWTLVSGRRAGTSAGEEAAAMRAASSN